MQFNKLKSFVEESILILTETSYTVGWSDMTHTRDMDLWVMN